MCDDTRSEFKFISSETIAQNINKWQFHTYPAKTYLKICMVKSFIFHVYPECVFEALIVSSLGEWSISLNT